MYKAGSRDLAGPWIGNFFRLLRNIIFLKHLYLLLLLLLKHGPDPAVLKPCHKNFSIMPPRIPLTPEQKRIRTIMISFPLLVATSVVLIKRLYLGEEQRKLPSQGKIAPPPA
ncbi:uncharacterized protein MEPE_02475 [Melanopsichium pennsylvanicum]|uniref:Uncharacterized protein n=2 Tax=Melanopsichium pennsylvanicum TaxID=63383 RepID=A0AAJ4XK22_9BASI|nr:uncharacterized protein MEPE_02475 [Melanopsichium pennsylvanicum]